MRCARSRCSRAAAVKLVKLVKLVKHGSNTGQTRVKLGPPYRTLEQRGGAGGARLAPAGLVELAKLAKLIKLVKVVKLIKVVKLAGSPPWGGGWRGPLTTDQRGGA